MSDVIELEDRGQQDRIKTLRSALPLMILVSETEVMTRVYVYVGWSEVSLTWTSSPSLARGKES